MSASMSLRRALQLRLLLPVALLLVFSSALAYGVTLHYANAIYDSWLYDIAHTVTLEVGEDGPEVVHTDEVEQQLKTWKTGDKDYYAIRVQNRVIAGETDLPLPTPRATGFSADAVVYDASRDGEALRMIQLHSPATDRRPAIDVQVAQNKGIRYELAEEIFYTVAVPAVLLIVIAALLIRGAIRGSLQGLDELTRQLASHPEGTRLSVDATTLPDELRGMTMAFAGLVERNNGLLKAQRQFIANAAHQLRSPMAATELHLDGVEHAATAAQRQISLQQLRRSVERSNRLANQLLSLARLEPNMRLRLAMGPIDLVETVRAAGTDYVPLALNKGIDLELDVPPEPVTIRGHDLLLREAVSNLVDNAVRYHPGGRAGGLIRIAVTRDDEGVAVTVSDNGPGIAPTLAGRLFTRFARGDEGTGDGAGLGMAIVREIVELHHGTVQAEPGDDGVGLTIRLRLPQRLPAEEPSDAESHA